MNEQTIFEELRELSKKYDIVFLPKSARTDVPISLFILPECYAIGDEIVRKIENVRCVKQRNSHEAYMLSIMAGDALSSHETSVPRP